jgi:hypothetical protein
MANPWFRMYSEFADDPKVQIMPEAMQRRLLMLMCSKCKGETLHETELAFHWRISETELAETKAVFLKKEFIDEDWNLLNWDKRQFISDSSTDRVRKYRQGKKQDETLPETNGTKRNVTVTPPDTDTDTDTEKTNTLAPSATALEASSPHIGAILLVDKTHFKFTQADVDGWQEAYPAVDVMGELRQMREWAKANPKDRKTSKGIRRFINSWLAREQDKPGGQRNVRTDAVLERQKQNLANIEAASRRLEGTHGAGGGFLSEPDASSGNARCLPEGVDADCGEERPRTLPERAMERAAPVGVLSIAQGYRG